jgi:aminopeptidase N
VLHYDLNLQLLPEEQKLKGGVGVSFNAMTPLDTLRLNLVELYTVSQVSMGSNNLSFKHYGDTLDIYLPSIRKGKVTVIYSGLTPKAIMPPWKGGFTWVKDKNGNHWQGLSCQGEGAKIFMPCLDHPSSEPWEGVDLKFTVPKPYFVAANGRLQEVTEEGENIRYHWSTDYPVNNYGINFTMGIFHKEEQLFTSVNGEKVPMAVYVLEQNKEQAPKLLEVLERSTRAHEKYFGAFPFPDDKIAVVETPYLGMEHQTINAYGNKYKYENVGGVDHDWLLHHELGHEWWANMVSVSDWAHFWIHEGVTTYGDWLFYREYGGEEVYMKHAQRVGSSIMNLKPVVADENTSSDEAYHIEVYYKGAFIMHSLRFILGDEVFFPMLKAFLSKKDHIYDQLVTTHDFTAFVQEYSGKDLQGFFDMYLYTTEVPEIIVEKIGRQEYEVSIPNISYSLPMEIATDSGTNRYSLSSEAILIESEKKVKVDPHGWFLKEVNYK